VSLEVSSSVRPRKGTTFVPARAGSSSEQTRFGSVSLKSRGHCQAIQLITARYPVLRDAGDIGRQSWRRNGCGWCEAGAPSDRSLMDFEDRLLRPPFRE
jgi:hypothetical protein